MTQSGGGHRPRRFAGLCIAGDRALSLTSVTSVTKGDVLDAGKPATRRPSNEAKGARSLLLAIAFPRTRTSSHVIDLG
jgi:hypothetical protein